MFGLGRHRAFGAIGQLRVEFAKYLLKFSSGGIARARGFDRARNRRGALGGIGIGGQGRAFGCDLRVQSCDRLRQSRRCRFSHRDAASIAAALDQGATRAGRVRLGGGGLLRQIVAPFFLA
jgi:hypothetical protein